MKITILKKEILFSHKPGVCYMVPGTSFFVKIYPTRIELENLEGEERIIFNWMTEGPVEKFIARLDLENERIEISGKTLGGFFRFLVFVKEKNIILFSAKTPEKGIFFETLGNVSLKEEIVLVKNISVCISTKEKLSFGMHKALDVSMLEERRDLKEILPLLFSLSQKVLIEGDSHRQGMAKYLEFPEEKKALEKRFCDLIRGGFSSFIPKLKDDYEGYLSYKETIEDKASPLILLKEIGKKIRSLFFCQEKNHLYVLPKLFKLFNCGRMIGIDCQGLGTMDFEWSERRIRKVIFYPKIIGEIVLHPKETRSFRLRYRRGDKGKRVTPGEKIIIKEKKTLFFDQFEK